MGKLTDKDLFEFVYRADTPQKIAIAERWLREHQSLTSRSTGAAKAASASLSPPKLQLSLYAEPPRTIRKGNYNEKEKNTYAQRAMHSRRNTHRFHVLQ